MGKNCTYFDKDTSVRGELTTSDLVVEGSFKGSIEANGNVVLRRSVNIDADITTSKLMVEEGARYNGQLSLTSGDK